MNKDKYEALSRLASFSLKLIGILGIIFVPVFWAITGSNRTCVSSIFWHSSGRGTRARRPQGDLARKGGEETMTRNIRVTLIAGIIVLSAGYALLVKKDPSIAGAVAAGYIALLLTLFLLLNVWKKP
jgi:hypothetical protein